MMTIIVSGEEDQTAMPDAVSRLFFSSADHQFDVRRPRPNELIQPERE
jgi:hypothetical protein